MHSCINTAVMDGERIIPRKKGRIPDFDEF
jgi:hypothetical protein